VVQAYILYVNRGTSTDSLRKPWHKHRFSTLTVEQAQIIYVERGTSTDSLR